MRTGPAPAHRLAEVSGIRKARPGDHAAGATTSPCSPSYAPSGTSQSVLAPGTPHPAACSPNTPPSQTPHPHSTTAGRGPCLRRLPPTGTARDAHRHTSTARPAPMSATARFLRSNPCVCHGRACAWTRSSPRSKPTPASRPSNRRLGAVHPAGRQQVRHRKPFRTVAAAPRTGRDVVWPGPVSPSHVAQDGRPLSRRAARTGRGPAGSRDRGFRTASTCGSRPHPRVAETVTMLDIVGEVRVARGTARPGLPRHVLQHEARARQAGRAPVPGTHRRRSRVSVSCSAVFSPKRLRMRRLACSTLSTCASLFQVRRGA